MAIDRGGLKYPIEIVDGFSASLAAFLNGIRESRREFIRFRRAVRSLGTDTASISAAARATLQLARSTKALTLAQSKADTSGVASAKARQLSETKILALQRARLATIKTIFQAQAAGKILALQCVALESKLRRETERRAIAALAASKAQTKAATASAVATTRATTGTRRLNTALKTTESTANRISFTFRRLFGILAAFTAARLAVRGFAQLIAGGVKFNEQIKQSQIGIAGLIVAVTDVRNAQGQLVEGAEAFVLANKEAIRQQQALRQDSLKTVATFQELNKTFQVAVAPGIAAGLSLDEIRKLSVRVTQAAGALDVPLNQLSEEIRALLTGNITGRTTRIATALGITPEDIRNAERMGNLSEFLEERFKAFGLTAQFVAATLTGTFARLRGVFQELTANAAIPLVTGLTDVLQGLIDKLTTISEIDGESTISLRPEAVAALQVIFESLTGILDTAQTLLGGLDFDTLINAATLFGGALELAGKLLVSLIAGAIRGFATLGQIIQPVVDLFNRLSDVFGGQLLAGVVQVGVVLVGLQLSLKLILGFSTLWLGIVKQVRRVIVVLDFLHTQLLIKSKLISASFITWSRQLSFVSQTMTVIAGKALLLAGALGLTLLVFKLVTEAILSVSLSFRDFFAIVGSIVQRSLNFVGSTGSFVIQFLVSQFKIGGAKIEQLVGDVIADVKALFDLELGASNDLKAANKSLRADEKKQREAKANAIRANANLEIAEGKKILAQQLADQKAITEGAIAQLVTRIEGFKSFQEEQARLEAEAEEEDKRGTFKRGQRELQQEELDRLRIAEAKLAISNAELVLSQLELDLTLARTTGAERELAVSKAKSEIERRNRNLRISNLNEEIRLQEQLVGQTLEGTPERVAREAQLNRLFEERLNILKAFDAEEGIRLFNQQQLDLIVNGTFFAGFGEGLRTLAEELPTAFQEGIEFIRSAIQGLGQFIATTIVDAFDPTKDNTIQERFASLLRSLAQQLLQSLAIKLITDLLAPAASPASSPLTIPLSVLGFDGSWKGGLMGGKPAASLAHFSNPRGLALGGPTSGPPQGVDRRDTVPIWAAPGEFMMRVAAVQKYGLAFMSQLNAGMLNPSSLSDLSASSNRARTLRPLGGFQTGGEVSNTVVDLPVAGAGAPTVLPVFPVNEAEMESLVAGGEATLLQFLKDHSDEIGINSNAGQ